MKKFLCALTIVILFCGNSFAASKNELKRMGTFLSNFTELRMYDIDVNSTLTDEDLIYFGIMHNYMNNFNTRIKHSNDDSVFSYTINKKYVDESIRKFFDIKVEHKDVKDERYPEIYFDGEDYYFNAGDGEQTVYADVQYASTKGNIVTMKGELYAPEDESERWNKFTATAKKHKWKGQNTWAIISLKLED